MLNSNDLDILKIRGISQETVEEQLNRFKTGYPFLRLAGSATVGNGILRVDTNVEQKALNAWQKYLDNGGEVCKFVPASGAASRMFKSLFAFVDGPDDTPKPGSDVAQVIENLTKMPFAQALDQALLKFHGENAKELIRQGRYKDVIAGIIHPDGLNYGGLPKGLLLFHRYNDSEVRTPVEEQLMEGAQTAAADGKVNVHFTVSENHRDLFNHKLSQVLPALEKKTGLKYNVTMSVQKPSTDTIAANPDGTPFRDSNGDLVFRPGGHGALISNLGDIESAVVFIKNIDNVVPDSLREPTVRYKKIIGGLLLMARHTIEEYHSLIKSGLYTRSQLNEILEWLRTEMFLSIPEGVAAMEDHDLAAWLENKLNRPLRVCGMVRNEGEPGGGPYIAFNNDGTASPQILESSQIDMQNPENVNMMKNATHFNPVDLVCFIKDLEGNHYKLQQYVDPNTGFISSKSYEGRELKALELPGLWNGAMSDWNTIFVEVPGSTFNPVKTVNDLLRPAHNLQV